MDVKTTVDEDALRRAEPVQTRRRGAALEGAIYQATLDELAETSFEELTLVRVATRAGAGKASVYSRWHTTGDLVLDALGANDLVLINHEAPDTGSLRTDLIAMLYDLSTGLEAPHGQALLRLFTQRDRHPALHQRIVELMVVPRTVLIVRVLEQAARRGEIDRAVITPILTSTGPRLLFAQHLDNGPISEQDVTAIVDEIILPAATRLAPLAERHMRQHG